MPNGKHRNLTQAQLSNNNAILRTRAAIFGSATFPPPLQPPPPPPPIIATPTAPPLITDTLTACLDVNGTYICSSYSPRCYIIQKVAPNSLTVTPAAATGHSSSSGGVVSSFPGLPYVNYSAKPPTSSSFRRKPLGQEGWRRVPSDKGDFATRSGHYGLGGFTGSSTTTPRFASTSRYPHHQGAYHCRHDMAVLEGGGYHHHHLRSSFRLPQDFEKSALGCASSSGGALMNGETSSSVRQVGESTVPTMVYPQPSAITPTLQGSRFNDASNLNGVIGRVDEMFMDDVMDAGETMDGTESKRGVTIMHHDVVQPQPVRFNDLPLEELKRLLLTQLEYYFSPDNLATDKYLVTQMDQDHYVPISIVAGFNLIKKMTSDVDLVTEVLRESKIVQVHEDGKRVRPLSQRTVVIMRGIPSSTSADEIKSLFVSDNCPTCTGCEFAHNDSWYVSFESDEDAMQAHRYLREDVKVFKGVPIMARIKSKPTTLLSQGVVIGVPTIKNGYNQAGTIMQPYMAAAPPFVPSNHQQPAASGAPASLYSASGQQVHQNVFPAVLPASYGFTPWPGGYFEMNPATSLSMYPMNGVQPQPSPGYPKSATVNTRPPRNLNSLRGVGPRRTLSSSSDGQGATTTSSSGNNGIHNPQSFASQPRKNVGISGPAPLLGIAPPNLVSHTPHIPTSQHHSAPHGSLPTANTIGNNGRHYNSYSQSTTHNVDNYHYSRPYRGGSSDTRPRSSMGTRRGTNRREDDASYDYNAAGSTGSNYRGNPSTRTAPPASVSPQIPPPLVVNNQNHQIDLDLEGSAFPPLPGTGNASSKNGDSHYEGRLSDVVKGVKNMRVGSGSSSVDKEEMPSEIVVSAAEPEPSTASSLKEIVVSAASQKEENELSSHFKKEYREIGVGGADEAQDIRSTHGRGGMVGGASRQTADKSTRTDETLLNGDQQSALSRGGQSQQSQSSVSTSKKSLSSQSSTSSKSPTTATANRGGSSPFQTVVSMGVGTEVPYPSADVVATKSSNNSISPSTTHPSGRGANSVAKLPNHQQDNNCSRQVSICTATTPANSLLGTTEREVAPSNSAKVPSPASAKPFSGMTDHNPKESARNVEDKKEMGQGDMKKEDCSNDENHVRLSYAQVARRQKLGTSDLESVSSLETDDGVSRKENVPTTTQLGSIGSSSNSTVGAHHNSPSQGLLAGAGAHNSTFAEDRKGKTLKDPRDTRPQTARGGHRERGIRDRDADAGRDRDRGRNYGNRGYRSRVASETSETGSTSGGAGKPINKGPRSPK